nr:hypothetical protein [Tanacetum cinerariifolium]
MNRWLSKDDDEEVEEDWVDDDNEEMEMDKDNGEDDHKDKAETEFAPPVVPIADINDKPIPPVIQFSHNFHIGEGSSARALLVGNSEINAPGPIVCHLESVRRVVTRLDKQMFDRYMTEKKMAKKFKEDEFRINGHEYDITALDVAVIEFGDSYEVPTSVASTATTDTASDETSKKKGRTITVTLEDMQKRKNDVKARTTLLLSLPDEHQLRFKWLMHTTVWRNMSDLDTMSLDNLYNHLKIDEDDMEEMDIKWNMALLSMRADKLWKKTRKKISIQGTDMAGFDKLKVECFNCHKMGHFARECRDPRSQDRGRRDNYIQGSKVEEQAPKALMEIDGVGWDGSYMANDEENHELVIDKEAPTEFALMANTSAESK